MKNIIVLSLTALLVLALAAPVAAAPAQYPAELEYITAQVDLFLPHLDTFQAQYKAQTGSYWQALQSHDTPPEGVAVPENLNSIPTDGDVSLAVMWDYAALPAQIGWAWSVDVYDGPLGAGYVLNVKTIIDGNEWRKSINRGPEPARSSDWWYFDPNF